MDEFRQNNRLRGALDAALSGLNGDRPFAISSALTNSLQPSISGSTV